MASPRVIDPSALASITAPNLILSAGFLEPRWTRGHG